MTLRDAFLLLPELAPGRVDADLPAALDVWPFDVRRRADAANVTTAPSAPTPTAPADADFQRGYAAGIADELAKGDERLSLACANTDRMIDDARRAWVDDESARIAQDIERQIAAQVAAISADVAAVLSTAAFDNLTTKTLNGIVSRIDRFAALGPLPPIQIRGRRDLVEALQRQLAARAYPATAIADDDGELTVSIDRTTIATRLIATLAPLARSTP